MVHLALFAPERARTLSFEQSEAQNDSISDAS